MKIHAIQTGTVKVKDCQRVGQGSGFMRQVNILRDRVWTDSLRLDGEWANGRLACHDSSEHDRLAAAEHCSGRTLQARWRGAGRESRRDSNHTQRTIRI